MAKIIFKKQNAKTLWVDLLCFESAIKILQLCRAIPVERIYYINIVKPFTPFVKLIENIVKKPIIQVTDVIEGEERLEDVSLFEDSQIRLFYVLGRWVQEDRIKSKIESFCASHSFNNIKFKAHLENTALDHMFRPVEILVIAERISGKENSIYVLRKTPFWRLITETFGKDKSSFYTTFISHHLTIENRPDYVRDLIHNEKYFSSRCKLIFRIFKFWLSHSLNTILFFLFKIIKNDRCDDQVNIGVELTQHRVRMDEINDIFWLQESAITQGTIYGIELKEYDKECVKILEQNGIKLYRFIQNPLKMLKTLIRNRFKNLTYTISPIGGLNPIKTFSSILKLLYPFIVWNESGWIVYQQINYICRTKFWRAALRNLGIRIYWAMYDLDQDRICKAQALEDLNGFFVTSHWSNYPIPRLDAQKYGDVLVAWGRHFTENIFLGYPYLAVFEVGYLLDHYFKLRKENAMKLRSRYPGKFILSYHDNIMANDVPYSQEMQDKMHKMLLTILEEYKDVIVFLKPKKEFVFQRILKTFPEIQKFIDEGRMAVFLGKEKYLKAVPAEIGMASDLVVGLGVSSAAAECFFAGTVSFHVDLTGFKNNPFGNQGLGEIVFRDIPSLQKAIEERIIGLDTRTHADFRKYYECLDPFQDGYSYRRVGFLMKKMQECFKCGMSRQETLLRVREEYNKYLKSTINASEVFNLNNV